MRVHDDKEHIGASRDPRTQWDEARIASSRALRKAVEAHRRKEASRKKAVRKASIAPPSKIPPRPRSIRLSALAHLPNESPSQLQSSPKLVLVELGSSSPADASLPCFASSQTQSCRPPLLTPSITEDDEASTHTGRLLLDRVKEIARGIEGRVRHALNPTDAPVTQLRILVVDDHPDAADSLAAVLELVGCRVRSSYDPVAALAVAAEFEPHVCLLDLMMPTMDGLELASHLKARAGSRPLLLIATTALGDWEARTRTALAGFPPSPHEADRHPRADRCDWSARHGHGPPATERYPDKT